MNVTTCIAIQKLTNKQASNKNCDSWKITNELVLFLVGIAVNVVMMWRKSDKKRKAYLLRLKLIRYKNKKKVKRVGNESDIQKRAKITQSNVTNKSCISSFLLLYVDVTHSIFLYQQVKVGLLQEPSNNTSAKNGCINWSGGVPLSPSPQQPSKP